MENNMKKCPKCGWEIARVATICPNCNYNFLEQQNKKRNQSKLGICSIVIGVISLLFSSTELGVGLGIIGTVLAIYVLFSKKELYYGTAIAGVIISLFAIIIAIAPSDNKMNNKNEHTVETTKENKSSKEKEDNKTPKAIPKATPKAVKKKEWEKTYENADIQFVNLKYLAKNAKYYKNQTIISVAEIYEIGESDLQFDTDESNFFKEVTCNFKHKKELSGLKEEDKVCFVGKVSDTNTYFGNETVTISNCYIVAKGKATDKYSEIISKKSDKQKKYVANEKNNAKKKKKEAAKNKKQSYMKQCKTYSYSKIQRKPDKYDGKKIKVSGTVIQVMEGWLDTVSLRIEDSSGNVWYVSYGYSDNESKILENDKVTVYGESTGTETYTTVLGNTQTIPSVDAEYIE